MHESWKICHDRKRWNEVQELRSTSRSRQEQLSGRSPWYPDSFCWQGYEVLRREGIYSAGNREPWLLYCIKELRRESDADIQGVFQEKTDIDLCKIQIKEYLMKKLLLFIAGVSILFLVGCSNGNQSHGNEGMGDSLPADPPLGYVVELKPLENFSCQEAEQLREELVKQLGGIFNKVPKAWVEASVFVGDKKEISASCLYKPRNRYWAGGS